LKLDDRLVEIVDVGALFPIHLDADVKPVHLLGDGRVFEALPLHDVAPMAR
jgi:hypothetical protein